MVAQACVASAQIHMQAKRAAEAQRLLSEAAEYDSTILPRDAQSQT